MEAGVGTSKKQDCQDGTLRIIVYFCRQNRAEIIKTEDMDVNMIVAAGEDGAIGRDGDLIWHISSDLKRFKALTMHYPVIMGRKTWESLPKRPLPGRLNIVVTRNPDYVAEGGIAVSSPAEALRIAEEYCKNDGRSNAAFVMGGAAIYKEFMPAVTRMYLTSIHASCEDADARLPMMPDEENWEAEERTPVETTPEGISYNYITYRRREA